MADFWDEFGDATGGFFGGGDMLSAGADFFGLGPRPGRRAANAALGAADTQRRYGEQANQFLGGQYDQAQGYFAPGSRAGQYGLSGLMSERFTTGAPAEFQYGAYQGPGQFNLSELENDPGYKFRLGQGLDAVQSRIGAQGGRGGGNAMTALNDYAQGFASNEVNNAFSRFANQRDFGRGAYESDRGFASDQYGDRFNRQFAVNEQGLGRFRGLADMGQNAWQNQSQNAMNYGQMYGNNLMGIGNSMAAGQVGAANARNQAGQNNLSSGLNLLALLSG